MSLSRRDSDLDIGREIVILNASTIAETDAAFATLRQKRVDALSVAIDAFFRSSCLRHGMG